MFFPYFELLLAAVHYNRNSDTRLKAVTREGREYFVRKGMTAVTYGDCHDMKCMRIKRKKKKGSRDMSFLFVFTGYTETLINVLVREYEEDQTSLKMFGVLFLLTA